MSIYLVNGPDADPHPVATNRGWGELADSVSDEYPALAHLIHHGYVEPASELSADVGDAAEDKSISEFDRHVLAEMAAYLKTCADDDAILCTNGMTASNEDDPEN